jgi:hypothetical protein
LKNNRDNWKVKCKENDDLKEKLKLIASTLEIIEEQQVRDEFNEVKKNRGFRPPLYNEAGILFA